MAHSSDDPEDSHMGHSSKPLYITNDASFTEEEKKAIACLVLLKHKPVVYNRSESRKEDAHNADHAQVGSNISSGPSQMANHNAGPSKTQVEAPSGFPVETKNYIGGFSGWRRFAKQIKDKDESEVELFRGILKNECQEDISYHGASADGNSTESPNAGFSSSNGYDKRIWEQKKKYFELKDEDKCDIELSLGNKKNEVYKDMGHHSASADNNNIENPNARFCNWKGHGKQLSKKTMCFESKDKGRSKDELFAGIRKDKAHKDIGHDGGRDEDINIENSNVRLSRWTCSNKQPHKQKNYSELKHKDQSKVELFHGIKKHGIYKESDHHGAGANDSSLENPNASFSNSRGKYFQDSDHHSAGANDSILENPNARFSNSRGKYFQDSYYHGAGANENILENPNASFSNSRGMYFHFKDIDECDVELSLGIRKEEVCKDRGHHGASADIRKEKVYKDRGRHGASVDNNSIKNFNVGFSNWKDSEKHISKRTEYFELKDKGQSKDKDEDHKGTSHHGAIVEDNGVEDPNAQFSRWKDSIKQIHSKNKYFHLKDKDELEFELIPGIRKHELHKDIDHHGLGADDNSIEKLNEKFSNWGDKCFELKDEDKYEDDFSLEIGKDEIQKDRGHHGVSVDDIDTKIPNVRFSNWKGSHKEMYKEKIHFSLKDKCELLQGIRKNENHNIGHHGASIDNNSTETPNIGYSHWKGSNKKSYKKETYFELEYKDELFLGIKKGKDHKDIGHHGASADDNSLENPNSSGKYFEFEDKDRHEDNLSLEIGKVVVHKDRGHHGVTADDNDTKNPNAKFTNWRDSHKQMYKEKMIFAMKDKNELLQGIREKEKDKVGHPGASVDDNSIETPNIGHSHWKGSNKQIYEHKKYFELKYTDELSLGIKKNEAHKDMCHHDTGTDGRFSNWQINKKNTDLKDKDEAYKDIGYDCANADDNSKINKENKKYFDINAKEEPEDEVLQKIRRDDVHKDIGNDDASADYNSMENPKTWVSDEGADININGKRVGSNTNRNDKCVRGRPRRRGQAIGVCDYQRSGRYEANIWLKKERRQIHLGQYFIAEAAARCSDKAMLVTRLSPERNLNYCAEDYDMKLIEEWRQVFSEDVSKFAEILREQSKKFSEGCVKGLNDEAASKLLQLIEERKKVEADAINKSSLI